MTVEIANKLVPRAEKKPKSTKAAPILKAARGWTAGSVRAAQKVCAVVFGDDWKREKRCRSA
jgi:hypothetical protein